MITRSSSGHNSRRSSILKLPKSRQPFQDLDFNVSSTENTPNSTKKRRVSFAEKKHVKEFCDHKEQGTIWDNTYEEPDQNESKLAEHTDSTDVVEGDDDAEQAGYNSLCKNNESSSHKTFVIMDPCSTQHYSTQIFRNSDADIELTDVITCSHRVPSPLSQTNLSDVDLDITETVGGIEPTVSVSSSRQNRASSSPANGIKDTEHTILFDNSDNEMKFTEVVGSGKIHCPMLAGVPPPPPQLKMVKDSAVENETIIFDDFLMDLTLTKSELVPGVDARETVEINISGADCNNVPHNNSSTAQTSNKTIIFNECSCDITEAVHTARQRALENSPKKVTALTHSGKPQIDEHQLMEISTKDQGHLRDGITNHDTEQFSKISSSDSTILEKENLRPYSSSNRHDVRTSQLDNKTILFSDFGCEMTEVVSTLRTRPSHEVHDARVNRVTVKPFVLNPSEVVTMKIQPNESSLNSVGPQRLIAQDNNQTQFFNESGMEFTTAITRDKNPEDKIQKTLLSLENPQSIVHHNSDIDFTRTVGAILCDRNDPNLECQGEPLVGTGQTSSESKNDEPQSNMNQTPNESNVNNDGSKYYNSLISKDPAYSLDITSADTSSSCILRSASNSETKNVSLSNGSTLENVESNELQSNKKRKSVETIENIDSKVHGDLSIDIHSEHDVVQSLSFDAVNLTDCNVSNTFTPNCKRFKTTKDNSKSDSLPIEDDHVGKISNLPENFASKSIRMSPPGGKDMSQTQSNLSSDAVSTSECVNNMTQQNPESDEQIFIVSATESCEDQGMSMNAEIVLEATALPNPTEQIIRNESHSFVEMNKNSESELVLKMEMMHADDGQQKSHPESKNCEDICFDSNNCLDYKDDCCFLMFSEELRKYAQRDNCIWKIRKLETKIVTVDFISKSLVVAIHLESSEELTKPDIIKDIRLISLLSDTADEPILLVHNILLKKFDSEQLKRSYRTIQDILPMLEVISLKVKLLQDFMYEFDKLQDLNLIAVMGNRISFRLHSYKVQLVFKITLNLELFEDVGPNDVAVECILGNISEKDIKQLITSVRKDHKFLTNYIDNIKEYMALVVEE